MLEGYIDFFMDPSLAECYVKLKEELDKLLQKKVSFGNTTYIKKEHAHLYVSYMCITEHHVMYSHVTCNGTLYCIFFPFYQDRWNSFLLISEIQLRYMNESHNGAIFSVLLYNSKN